MGCDPQHLNTVPPHLSGAGSSAATTMGQASSTSDGQAQSVANSHKDFFKQFKLESKVISQETLALIQSHVEKGDIQKTVSVINAALKDIENAPLTIAVTGESGAGKSTLINALRGVGHEDQDAAPCGAVETTLERIKYTHPKLPNVTIWDLPGIGTLKFKPEKYLKSMKFGEYDFFLIISSTRFKSNDADLAKAITKMKKKFYFIRTKIDSDLRDQQLCCPKRFNRDQLLDTIRVNCVKNLEEAEVDTQHVFLVSSIELGDFDFPELQHTLLQDLPAQKRHIFIQCLPNVTEDAVERRRDSLKQIVWLEALKSGAKATIPMASFFTESEIDMLQEKLDFYRSSFGLDDASLKSMAKDLSLPLQELRGALQSPHLLSVDTGESAGDKMMRYLENFLKVTGGLLATGLYFGKTFYLQNYFLNVVVSDAKLLLKKEDIFGK